MLPKITVDQMMEFDPCDDYSRERATELWAGREALDAREIAALDIPAQDRVWALTRPGVLPQNIIYLWMAQIVERALGRVETPDPRSLAVATALRSAARGEAVDWAEVFDAAYAAFTADIASYAAACAAAYAASAADAAASSAADTAAESGQQIADLLKILDEEGL